MGYDHLTWSIFCTISIKENHTGGPLKGDKALSQVTGLFLVAIIGLKWGGLRRLSTNNFLSSLSLLVVHLSDGLGSKILEGFNSSMLTNFRASS